MSVETASNGTAARRTTTQRIVGHVLRFWPDFYGERSFFGPRYRAKTSLGGCISICSFLIICVLLVYTWVQFFGASYFLSSFGTLHVNSLLAIGKRNNITALRNIILPTLSLYISAASHTTASQQVVTPTIMQSPTTRVARGSQGRSESESVTRRSRALLSRLTTPAGLPSTLSHHLEALRLVV